jgi:hypothetical protein
MKYSNYLIRRARADVSSPVIKQGGNIVSYFCMPDGEVLHFVIGPVSGKRFLQEAEFAKRLFETIRSMDSWTERMEAARQEHEAASQPGLLRLCESELLAHDWEPLEGNTPSRGHATRATDSLVSAIQLGCFGKNERPGPSSPQCVRATGETILRERQRVPLQLNTSDQWETSKSAEHVLMAHIPLAYLEYVEQPIWEAIVGEVYRPRSSANDEVLRSVQAAFAESKCLLVTLDLPTSPSQPDLEEALAEERNAKSALPQFLLLYLKEADFLTLLSDLGQPPPQLSPRRGGCFAHFFINHFGRQVGELPEDAPIGNVAFMMKRVLEISNALKEKNRD